MIIISICKFFLCNFKAGCTPKKCWEFTEERKIKMGTN